MIITEQAPGIDLEDARREAAAKLKRLFEPKLATQVVIVAEPIVVEVEPEISYWRWVLPAVGILGMVGSVLATNMP